MSRARQNQYSRDHRAMERSWQEFWREQGPNIAIYISRLRDYRLKNSRDQSSQGFKFATTVINGRPDSPENEGIDKAIYDQMILALNQKIREANHYMADEESGDRKKISQNKELAQEIEQLKLDIDFLQKSFTQHMVHDKGLNAIAVSNSSDLVLMVDDISPEELKGGQNLANLLKFSLDKSKTDKFSTTKAQIVIAGGPGEESVPFALTLTEDGDHYGAYGGREKSEISFGVIMQQEKLNFRRGHISIERGYVEESQSPDSENFFDFTQELLLKYKEANAHEEIIVTGSEVEIETKDGFGFADAIESILMDISKSKKLSAADLRSLQQYFAQNTAIKLCIYDNKSRDGRIMTELDNVAAQELFSMLIVENRVATVTHELIDEVLQGQQARHELEKESHFVHRAATRKPIKNRSSPRPNSAIEGEVEAAGQAAASSDNLDGAVFSSRRHVGELAPVVRSASEFEDEDRRDEVYDRFEGYYAEYKKRFNLESLTKEQKKHINAAANLWDHKIDPDGQVRRIIHAIRDARESFEDGDLDLTAAFQSLIEDEDIPKEQEEALFAKLFSGLEQYIKDEEEFARPPAEKKSGPLLSRLRRSPSSEPSEIEEKTNLQWDVKFLQDAFFAHKNKDREFSSNSQFHLVRRVGGDSFEALKGQLEAEPKSPNISTHLIWSGTKEETTPDDPLYHGASHVELGMVFDQEKVTPAQVTMVHCSYPRIDGVVRPKERQDGPYPISPLVLPIATAAQDFRAQYHESKHHHQERLSTERLEYMRTIVSTPQDAPLKNSVSAIFVDISHSKILSSLEAKNIEEYLAKNSHLDLVIYDNKSREGDTMRRLDNAQAQSFLKTVRSHAQHGSGIVRLDDVDHHLSSLKKQARSEVKPPEEVTVPAASPVSPVPELARTPRSSTESISGPTPPRTPDPTSDLVRQGTRRKLPTPPAQAAPAPRAPWQPPTPSPSQDAPARQEATVKRRVLPAPPNSPSQRSSAPGTSPVTKGNAHPLAQGQARSSGPVDGSKIGKEYLEYGARTVADMLANPEKWKVWAQNREGSMSTTAGKGSR